MGFDGINVELACREYMNDVKRPTIFQSMVYNLEKSKIIRYKNFKINVLSATEEELNYVVVED
jgi:hypothetical protein